MTIRTYLVGMGLFALSFLPATSFAQTTVAEDAYRATLIELIATLQQQIAILQEQLTKEQTAAGSFFEPSGVLSMTVDEVVMYPVRHLADVQEISNDAHRAYFERVFELFPEAYADQLQQVQVFGGDEVAFDAYVETLPPSHETWSYAAHEAILADPDSQPNTELIVHELAHLIAYEEVPGLPKPATASCPDYFAHHGCPPANSYLMEFADEFWTANDLARAETVARSTNGIARAYEYYEDNPGDFVSDYAAINPEEDFSETFMYFVFGLPVTGAKAQEKVEFFSTFRDMRSVKADILSEV